MGIATMSKTIIREEEAKGHILERDWRRDAR